MPGRLEGRIALITGASSGIGRATAFAYAKEGAKLICTDINPGTWRETAPDDESNGKTHERIVQSGGEAIYIHCDVTDPKSVEAAVKAAVDKYGRLDVFINNAGFALEARAPAPIWETDLDLYHKTIQANVNGVFYGTKYAAAQMIKQDPLPSGDRGWILNAASVLGLRGSTGAPAYCTSKGAVANLTRAAALDCAPYRVHVNAVNPGYTQTHMTDAIFTDPATVDAVSQLHPFRGIGKPEDLAKVYVFLASDDAQWISGVNLPVDGCYTAK